MSMLQKSVIFTTIILAFFSFSLFSAESAAKEEEGTPMFTEEVEVVGNVPVTNTIQSVSIFKLEEMENFNFDSLKSVLKLTPGLLTLSSGQFGQTSSTYIRGSRPSQVLYLVDGVKLRDGANIGGVNLAVLSPNLIDKIEVVRGPLSNIYGSDAMGGVVSMNTFSKKGADFLASIGSHGSYTGSFSGGTNMKNFNLGLAVNTQRYSDDVVNDVFKNTGVSAKVDYKSKSLESGFRFFGNFTDSGIPMNLGAPTPERWYKQNYTVLALPFTYTIDEGARINARLSYTNSKYQFEDVADVWSPYFMSKFDNYETELIYSGTWFEKLNLSAGIDYSDQKILSETDSGRTLDNEKMNYFSAFVNTGLNFKALQLSASLRYDKYKNVEANFSPQIGASYLVGGKFKIRAAYSESFQAPLVSHQINPWGDPNFDLKPEKGKSFETGVEFYSAPFTFSATYFITKYEDMIEWVTTDWVTYAGQYRNLVNVDVSGLEFSATVNPVKNLTFTGSYSYLKTEDKETGEPLLRKPEHTVSAFAAYAHKRFTLSISMIYVGKRPDLDYAGWPPEVENPAFDTYDLSLVVPVWEGLSVFGKITNAFDKEYQEFVGYPSPGRRFELGLKYKMK